MKAIVVYESHWGNTAAIARAIAEGIGPDARAMSTAEATAEVVSAADLIVAGAPLLGFNLPTDTMVKGLSSETAKGGPAPDLSHPTMRAWLDALPESAGRAAAFETKISWSPGSASKAILGRLKEKGYREAAKPERFVVKDRYGPLKEGELERAKAWGAELAKAG
jgi:flavorubredoxin